MSIFMTDGMSNLLITGNLYRFDYGSDIEQQQLKSTHKASNDCTHRVQQNGKYSMSAEIIVEVI